MSLDKNPGLPPTVVGKMLHRIAGKLVIIIMKGGVKKAVWNSQLCGGQRTGCKAAVYSMHDIFATNETEAVLLNNAGNAFNSINRQVFLHNIRHIIFPPITTLCLPVECSILWRHHTRRSHCKWQFV